MMKNYFWSREQNSLAVRDDDDGLKLEMQQIYNQNVLSQSQTSFNQKFSEKQQNVNLQLRTGSSRTWWWCGSYQEKGTEVGNF